MGPRAGSLAVAAALVATTLAGCSDDTGPDLSSDPPASATQTDAPAAQDGAATADEPAEPRARQVTRPRTAKQAAAALVAAQQAIRDPATAEKDLVRAARSQQLAYRELGTRPRWDAAVLAGVPRSLRADVRANVASRREFRSMHTTLADTLPAWRIVEPAPAEDLLKHYRAGEAAYGVGWEYLAAINLVETGMGRIRGTSVAGAQGPMQFIPSTWARWGRGDVNDPGDAIMAAARYLAHNGGDRPARLANALFRYNNDVRYVRGVTHLAQVMEREPRAFYGYYHWDVYYLTSRGDVRLPVGYERTRPVPVQQWLATHPQA